MRAREGSCEKQKTRTLWLVYSALFVVFAFLALFVYPSNGRSIVWSIDGLEQYYPFFLYEGQWLREVVGGLFSGQGLVFPAWEFSLGYGTDVFLSVDAFLDPLNLLSGLCPEAYSEYLFQFLIVVRMYLAGAAFIAFARYKGLARYPVICGALLYALCGTAMCVLHWPGGIWPMILFPLLLLGVEKIFQHERPYLFIAVIAAFFIISYYFAYMACLLLLLYCAIRVFSVEKPMTVGRFLKWFGKLFGLSLIGIALAGFVLVPGIIALLSIDRVSSSDVTIPLFYSLDYYLQIFSGFIAHADVGSDCLIGFGGIALVACIVLFTQKKSHAVLKAFFIVLSLFLLIPFVGSVFNGFNYATNRWVWAYAFCVAYIVAVMVPLLLSLGKREMRTVFIAVTVYTLLLFVFPDTRTEASIAAVVVLLLVVIVIMQTGLMLVVKQAALVCCIGLGVVCSTYYLAAPDEGGWGYYSSPIASLYTKLTEDAPNHLVADLEDGSPFWRYDGDPTATVRTRNDSIVLGLRGVDFYNSVYNNDVDRFHTELALSGTAINASYSNLDGRSILDTLVGVKYMIVPDAQGTVAPYNYNDPQKVVATGLVRDEPYTVYEASTMLPLGFTYDTAISRETYERLTPIQKQEALLQGVVLEDSSLPETDLELESTSVSYEIASLQGLTVEDGTINVASPNATMTLTFQGKSQSETYIYLSDLGFRGISPREAVSDEEFENMSWYRKADLLKRNLEWSTAAEYKIAINGAVSGKVIENTIPSHHLYGGKDDWLLNLGYTEEGQTTITLTFPQTGEYSFNAMEVLCQPMKTFSERVDALKAESLENIVLGPDEVTGTIDVDQAKTLFLSIPYSKGWTAYVDGSPVDLKKANTAFLALDLEPGAHDIKLVYKTPGLQEGLAVSGLGVLALVAVVAGGALGRRKHAATARESLVEKSEA